jgi:hypothetical protein
MQSSYWPTWKKYLARRGLLSSTCAVIEQTKPLIPLSAQLLFLGLPFFKGNAYQALLNTLSDEDALSQFTSFLQEAEL